MLLNFWKKMRVAFSHFIGLMSNPGIDHSLIDSNGCTVADKAMAEDVPAS